jgi:hypothetical protein
VSMQMDKLGLGSMNSTSEKQSKLCELLYPKAALEPDLLADQGTAFRSQADDPLYVHCFCRHPLLASCQSRMLSC